MKKPYWISVVVFLSSLLLCLAMFAQLIPSGKGGNGIDTGTSPGYGTNLWLSINVSNNAVDLLLHNTQPGVPYLIRSREDLASGAWFSEGTVTGAIAATTTPATISIGGRTNRLFLQAFAWMTNGAAGTPPMLAVGGERLMELTTNGDVISWGGNQYGELGDYTHLDNNVPVYAVGLTNMIKIAAGVNHTLAIDAQGGLWAWGDNGFGQLGDGNMYGTNVPVRVSGMASSVVSAAGSYNHSVAVKADGAVWTWGRNWAGQLGIGNTDDTNVPVQVECLTNAVAAAAGHSHTLALLSDGTVWAWGDDSFNQFGDGNRNSSSTPVPVPGLPGIVAICAGGNHNLALDTNGNVWAWGSDSVYVSSVVFHPLGVAGKFAKASAGNNSDWPVMVAGLANVVGFAAGASHSLALDNEGNIWAWGDDGSGQLGDGGPSNNGGQNRVDIPMRVLGMTNIIAIAAGSDASVALDGNGNLRQWGASDSDGTNWAWGDETGLPALSPAYFDFYNGQLPNLTILSGNNQTSHADLEFEQPLVFRVTDTNGTALSNAPVSVEIIMGGMELRTVSGGDNYKGLRLTTDANGEVSLIGYAHRHFHDTNCFARVLAASREQLAEVDFSETLVPLPTVNITSPTNGNTYLVQTNQGLAVTVTAQAAPDSFIQEVDYYYQINGGNLAFWNASTQPPFSFVWTNALWWTNAFVGQCTLLAAALDNTGVWSDTNSVTVTVALDSVGDGLPDWWKLGYVGQISLNGTCLDAYTNTLHYDYQNGLDPNDINFALQSAGFVFNNGTANVTIAVLRGVPAYQTVLVNDTNSADWQFGTTSNVVVSFDSGDGEYDVWVGLRGPATNAQPVWREIILRQDTATPVITITAPAPNSTVSVPLLQVQGFANKPLNDISYDVSNAAGIITNQTGYVTGRFYDTNLLAFTTNSFQCYDVALVAGVNTITLRVTDLGGNTITTNFSVTLDYSGDTTPPALTVIWPQDGTAIAENEFTLQARVDDATATVKASIVDAQGNTNNVQGLVERDGTVWVNNLPLSAGANVLTLTVLDAAGNIATINLTLYQSSILVTMNPPDSAQMNQSSMNVSGTVSDPTALVTVNGVAATVNSDGTWTADNVLVSAGRTAVFDVEVAGVNHSAKLARLASGTLRSADQPDSSTGSGKFALPKPVTVVEESFHGHWTVNGYAPSVSPGDSSCWWPWWLGEYNPEGFSFSWGSRVDWTNGLGGSCTFYSTEYTLYNEPAEGSCQIPPGDWTSLYNTCGYGWEHADVDGDAFFLANGDFCNAANHLQSQVIIQPSGQEVPGKTAIYLVRTCAMECTDPGQGFIPESSLYFAGTTYAPLHWWTGGGYGFGREHGDVPLPPEWLQIQGQTLVNTGQTNDYGAVWGATTMTAPAGTNVDVTPSATQLYGYNDYTFDVQALDITRILAVDYNRNGQIALDGSDDTTPAKPFRFWINDSTEYGDIVSGATNQIPGQPAFRFIEDVELPYANYAFTRVNGRSDLVNFFPVALCLSNTLQWLPPTNGFEYHLIQNDSAVKFVYTSLTLTNAFDYLTNTVATNGYGTNFIAAMTNFDEAVTNADTIQVPNLPPGVLLDTNWLAWVQTNNGGTGIILMEGCTNTTKPLWLEIWHKDQSGNNKLMGGVPLYLSIDGVEKMYRHKNLRDGAEAPSGLAGDLTVRDNDTSLATQVSEPANYPDSLYNQWFFAERWFIFVVGSNVGGQNARGWESEVFKRMYWSGNKAKFVGVSWYGDPYTNSEGVYDYHMAVRNAFATAPSLASFVNGLSGNKTIAGHSLGCGLIASAIADYSMNVNNACLMDAAIAQECFDGDADDNLTAMRPAAWQDYSQELWAAHWHELFTDSRWYLTWRSRFAGAIGKVYNFYSSTEDALGEYNGELPINAMEAYITSGGNVEAYVWTYQEKAKGNRRNYYVIWPGPGHFHVGSTYGGWGFNIKDPLLPDDPVYYDFISFPDVYRTNITSAEASSMLNFGTINNDVLQRHPFFEPGWGGVGLEDRLVNQDAANFCGPSWIMGLYTTSGGNTIAADRAKRSQLLAEAIPALSLPVGANLCSKITSARQFDMAIRFADSSHWQSIHGLTDEKVPKWWHSDMDQVAYPFIYRLYNKLVSISNQ